MNSKKRVVRSKQGNSDVFLLAAYFVLLTTEECIQRTNRAAF